MNQKTIAQLFWKFNDLLSEIFNHPKVDTHGMYFLLRTIHRLSGRIVEKIDSPLTPEQVKHNDETIERFLEEVAEGLLKEVADTGIEVTSVSFPRVNDSPIHYPTHLKEKRRPFVNETRYEAREWINDSCRVREGVVGDLKREASADLVADLYSGGAVKVEVVDPIGSAGSQSCSVLRVELPFDPSEDVKSSKEKLSAACVIEELKSEISVYKALACLELMTDLKTARVQQAWDEQTTFYVIW